MKPDNEICGVLFKHEKDVYSYWSDFTLTESEKKTIMGILSKHETEGQSVYGTKRELLDEFESLNATESCDEGKQNAKKIDYTNDKIVTIL